MEKVNDSFSSIMLSCTKNVLLTIAGICLVYFSFVLVTNNWTSITNNIMSFLIIFNPIKTFLFEHLGKIFIGWLILSVWSGCIFYKIETSDFIIQTPTALNALLFMLIPTGSLIFFLLANVFEVWLVSAICVIIALIMLFTFLCITCCILFPGTVIHPVDSNQEQLDLFNNTPQ